MVCATHRQHRGARRKSLVKYIDLRTIVASELKCEQREQHRFAGAGRSDDQHMADVADVRAEPKRCRAAGLGVEQWRSVEVRVAPWSDRKSVVWGKSVSVRVDLGGRRLIKKQKI